MQALRIPYSLSSEVDRAILREWMRQHAAVVRSAYANAVTDDGAWRSEADLRNFLKARFTKHPLGTWAIHCATQEGLRLRRQTPDGNRVFGGKAELQRRSKSLISAAEWRERRHTRAITIAGDRTYWGNRHFRLINSGRICEVSFRKTKIELHLPVMNGKQRKLLKAVTELAAACEINITFDLGPTHLTSSSTKWTCASYRLASLLRQPKSPSKVLRAADASARTQTPISTRTA